MWLAKIFGKKKEIYEEEKKEEIVTLIQVYDKLNQANKIELEKLKENVSIIVDSIKDGSKKLINNINILSKTEIGDVEDKIKPIVKSAKEQLSTTILTKAEELNLPSEINVESLRKLNASLAELFVAVANSRRNFFYLSIAHHETMGEIKELLVSLEDNALKIKNIVESGNFKKINEMKQILDSMFEIDNKNKDIQSGIDDFQNKISFIKDNTEESRLEIDGLKTSRDYFDYINNEKEIEKTKEDMEKVKTALLSLLSPAQRPLRKFEKIIIEKDKAIFIKKFLDEPLIVIENYDKLKLVLLDLLDAIKKNKITMLDRDDDKRTRSISDILETNIVPENILKYQELLDKMVGLKKDFPVIQRMTELEKSLNSEEKIKGLEKEKTELEKILSKNNELLNEKKNNIQDMFSKLGFNVIIE